MYMYDAKLPYFLKSEEVFKILTIMKHFEYTICKSVHNDQS